MFVFLPLFLQLPNMRMLSPRAARWVTLYQDRNGLVPDPCAELDAEQWVRPWSPDELRTFSEKFLAYHKDFQRIATYLPGRTVPEVVRCYYAVQRSEEFETTRRKWQLRKRREKVSLMIVFHHQLCI